MTTIAYAPRAAFGNNRDGDLLGVPSREEPIAAVGSNAPPVPKTAPR